MKTSYTVALLVLQSMLQSCTSITKSPFLERNYEIGTEYEISRGEDLVSVRQGLRVSHESFVGLAHGGFVEDKWEEGVEEHRLTFEDVRDGYLETTYTRTTTPVIPLQHESPREPAFAHKAMESGYRATRQLDFSMAPGGVHSQAGIRFEIVAVDGFRLRYRVLADPFEERGSPRTPD